MTVKHTYDGLCVSFTCKALYKCIIEVTLYPHDNENDTVISNVRTSKLITNTILIRAHACLQ